MQLAPWLVLPESDSSATVRMPEKCLRRPRTPKPASLELQGPAETLAAWKVSQTPKSAQHRDELIFFNEKDKRQVYSKLNGKKDIKVIHGPGRPAGLGSVCEQFVLMTE